MPFPLKTPKYILKDYAHVPGVCEDKGAAHDFKHSAGAMHREGVTSAQVLEEPTPLYGIPRNI